VQGLHSPDSKTTEILVDSITFMTTATTTSTRGTTANAQAKTKHQMAMLEKGTLQPHFFVGITKCPHCHLSLKRPLAHFNCSPPCLAHFTQISQTQIEQSLSAYFQEKLRC
jgi:hypothetical protein